MRARWPARFPLCKNIQSGSSLVDERLSKTSWRIYKNIFFSSNKSNKCLFLVMDERLDFEFFAYHFVCVWELRHVLIIWNPRELSHRNLKAMPWLVSFWEWHAQLCSTDVCGEGEWVQHKKQLQGGYIHLFISKIVLVSRQQCLIPHQAGYVP